MIRIGIIGGTGLFAETHIQGIARTEGLELVWLHGRNQDRLRARAEEWGVEAIGDWRGGLETVDAVVLCTPPAVRREPIEACAEAGTHVFCEKPIALTAEEGQAIARTVRDAGIVCQVGFAYRFHPLYRQVALLALQGQLGELVYAYVHAFEFGPSSRWVGHKADGHWRGSYETSGGRILELGSHWVDWLAWVGGKPARVMGHRHAITAGIDVDDADLMTVEFQRGTGRLEMFRCGVAVESIDFGIVGTEASVRCDLQAGTIRLRRMDEEQETELDPMSDCPTRWEHFRDCIAAGITPEADVAAGLTSLGVGLAFNASAESGGFVDVTG